MADLSTLARPYAKAAFDHAKEQQNVGDWHHYLTVMKAIVSDKAFADYLHNPAVAASAKVSALTEIYQQATGEDSNNVFKTLSTAIDGNAQVKQDNSDTFVNFLTQLAEQDRLTLLPSIAERFDVLQAADAKEHHAYVTSAYPLTPAQQLLIENRLAASVNGSVVLHVDVDASLIAGVIIKIGDKVIDDSVRGKLKQLKTQLTA